MGQSLRKQRKRVIATSIGTIKGDGWMITLSDMLLLILTFFVLLISMSSFDPGLLTETFVGLRPGSSGVLYKGSSMPIVISSQKAQKQILERKDLAYYRRLSPALSKLLDQLEKRLGKALVNVSILDGNLELEIMSDKLFGSLDDNLKPQGQETMLILGRFLQGWTGLLEIEVYTDNFPLHTSRFPDNNVLSARRGERLVEALVASGSKRSQVLLAAYGADRAVTINDTPQHRQRNRRIILRLPNWVALAGIEKSA